VATRGQRSASLWWVGLAILSIGLLSWAAFLYVGRRAGRRDWLIAAGVYLVWAGVALAMPSTGLQGTILALCWLVSSAHAFWIGPDYLRAIGAVPVVPPTTVERAEERLREREYALELVRTDPHQARVLGVGRPDVPDAFDAGLVDVNSAPALVIAHLPGVDPQTAARIATLREQVDGFASVEELGSVAGLDGGTVERIRDFAVFLPRT
jgi:DNA uptake protein ComE-like DNA-binding protein